MTSSKFRGVEEFKVVMAMEGLPLEVAEVIEVTGVER